jgi:hypothetical protein
MSDTPNPYRFLIILTLALVTAYAVIKLRILTPPPPAPPPAPKVVAEAPAEPPYDGCKQGYVWREARNSSDHVCVTPETRAQAWKDNAEADSRRKTGTRDECIDGFVPRDPGLADYVCVRPETAYQATLDDMEKFHRRANSR